MGIVDEDIARVRAATDFVAVAAEHIALKRVGRQYQGLCPFHSEKSPSFSINPEKGVYYCYGCQASGDVISFVRELEKLDFAQAVERLASKAGLTLRYDSEAAGKDRIKRAKLVESMEKAVDWYHDRLMTSPDAGAARKYLRSRGYDGAAIRHFKIGWAPDGWDTLCKSIQLPNDVAKDTGLGFVNKVGKVNDFFQKRILFPIFDQSGAPVAFGGRKMPDADGPKYKNSSETKLYSKSRVLYGLNWAKVNIVETGEVIVCEGYTDVIGFHLAGLPRAVATCGTALADEHFKTLKNYARRIVLGYDADNAGQNAAAKFFAWEKQYEIDLYVVALPPGADPADVARNNPQDLHDAVANAKPFLAFRVERVLSSANLTTAEGRARAYEAAAAVVMEHPSPIVREQYLLQVAGRCQVSEDSMMRTLSAPPPVPPNSPAPKNRKVFERNGGSSPREPQMPYRGRSGPGAPASTGGQRQSGEVRAVANEDPGHAWDSPGWGAPQADEPGPSEWGARGTWNDRRPNQQGQRPSGRPPPASTARASSSSLRARAAEQRSRRGEEEALRWGVQEPERVMGWLHPFLFSDPVHVRAVELLQQHGDVLAAADAVLDPQDTDEQDPNTEAPETPDGHDNDTTFDSDAQRTLDLAAIQTLRRLAVSPPLSDDVDDALGLVVANAAARVIATITSEREFAHPEELAAIGTVKLLTESLREPTQRVGALTQLVPWLASWDAQRRQVTREPAGAQATQPTTETESS